jgi:hypothetical protein
MEHGASVSVVEAMIKMWENVNDGLSGVDIPGPLITSFRNAKQLIPEHFDPINLLIINCNFLNCVHNSVLQSARNSLVKPSGISTLIRQFSFVFLAIKKDKGMGRFFTSKYIIYAFIENLLLISMSLLIKEPIVIAKYIHNFKKQINLNHEAIHISHCHYNHGIYIYICTASPLR